MTLNGTWNIFIFVLLCIWMLFIFTKQSSTFLGIQDKHGRLQLFLIIKLCGVLLYKACNQFLNRLWLSCLDPLGPKLWQFKITPLPKILWFWKLQITTISEQLTLRALEVSVDTLVHVYPSNFNCHENSGRLVCKLCW